jgi:SPP1 family predicted phage head-tail adaptor
MSPIDAGRLNQRITLRQRAAGLDALGQESGSWTDVATVWASAEPLRGREFFAAGQVQTEASTRFRIRYLAGVVPTMQVVWNGAPYDINAVIDVDGRKHTLELMCVQGGRDGR